MTVPDRRRGNHYDVLGVPPGADDAAVRRAYVALARRHHPDVAGGDAARMRAINDAWTTLGDPARRAAYDRALHLDESPRAPEPPDLDDLLERLEDGLDLDDRPLHPGAHLPRWASLLPAALFAAAVVTGVVGVVLASEPLLALALVAFVLSCLFFLAAPFIALFASRRSPAERNGAPH